MTIVLTCVMVMEQEMKRFPTRGSHQPERGVVHMTTTTCTFCSANETAFAARIASGVGSTEHRAALAVLAPMFELARFGNAHSAGCDTNSPLVVLG